MQNLNTIKEDALTHFHELGFPTNNQDPVPIMLEHLRTFRNTPASQSYLDECIT